MNTRTDVVSPESDVPPAATTQWAAWLHELTVDRPALREAIDHCLRALVVDARRRQMLARLNVLNEQDLAAVAAVIASLQQHPPDSP